MLESFPKYLNFSEIPELKTWPKISEGETRALFGELRRKRTRRRARRVRCLTFTGQILHGTHTDDAMLADAFLLDGLFRFGTVQPSPDGWELLQNGQRFELPPQAEPIQFNLLPEARMTLERSADTLAEAINKLP